MINGNIDEFVDKLWGGEELIFIYNGHKYFSQGYCLEDGAYVFEIQLWDPEIKVLWKISGEDNETSYEQFLKQPIFEGKTFWEIEKYIEWVDY